MDIYIFIMSTIMSPHINPQTLLYLSIDEINPKGVILALEKGADMRKNKNGILEPITGRVTIAYRYATTEAYNLDPEQPRTKRRKIHAIIVILKYANKVFRTAGKNEFVFGKFDENNEKLTAEGFNINIKNLIDSLILAGNNDVINNESYDPTLDILEDEKQLLLDILDGNVSGGSKKMHNKSKRRKSNKYRKSKNRRSKKSRK